MGMEASLLMHANSVGYSNKSSISAETVIKENLMMTIIKSISASCSYSEPNYHVEEKPICCFSSFFR